jgi:hypothetical protein
MDDGKAETYKTAATIIEANKIMITYNSDQIIYLEKSGDYYTISGSPIYFINPGSDDMPLKKIE